MGRFPKNTPLTKKPMLPYEVLLDRKKNQIRRLNWKNLMVSLVCTAVVTLFTFSVMLGLAIVKGDSMRPAVKEKDIILYYRMGGCQRGDIIILQANSAADDQYIKRIVGTPGDTVEMNEAGSVFIDGKELKESYAIGTAHNSDATQFPVALGKGEYFVLGDNREKSSDSREFGKINEEQIEGKVIAVLRIGK